VLFAVGGGGRDRNPLQGNRIYVAEGRDIGWTAKTGQDKPQLAKSDSYPISRANTVCPPGGFPPRFHPAMKGHGNRNSRLGDGVFSKSFDGQLTGGQRRNGGGRTTFAGGLGPVSKGFTG